MRQDQEKSHVRLAKRVTVPLVLVLLTLMIVTLPSSPARIVAQTGSTPTPLPLFSLPDSRANRAYVSNTMAMGNDRQTMVAANMINNSITILIPQFNRVVAEIPVGIDPRSVAITPDSIISQ